MAPLNLTTDQRTYLHNALNRVARTFALLPPFLDAGLADVMSTAYLVCRVLDNVEDCHEPFASKQARFADVRTLLHDPAAAPAILARWEKLSWQGLSPDELSLMGPAEGLPLWQIYAELPDIYQAIIRRWSIEMADGMEGTLNPHTSPALIGLGKLSILSELDDYNRYCYYVAGTVGYLQTELLEAFYGLSAGISQRLRDYSLSFGLGLQKTNIVKDFLVDLNRGICYLPLSWMNEIHHRPLQGDGATLAWVRLVLEDVKGVLDEAVEYVSALPYRTKGVRLATLMCLLPAYQTILLAAQRSRTLFTPEHQIKISRRVMARCLSDAHKMAADNELLWRYRGEVHLRFEKAFATPLE